MSYEIDLRDYTCSCPDWSKRRAKYDKYNPKRLCKHLVQEIYDNGLEGEFEGIDLEDLAFKCKGVPLPKKKKVFTPPKSLVAYLGESPNEAQAIRFRALFGGGREVQTNFTMFKSRTAKGPAVIHCPPSDYYRKRCEALAATGLLPRGLDIEPAVLLQGLPLASLRSFAKAHELGTFRTKQQGAELITNAANWQSIFEESGILPEDIFFFKPVTIKDLS